MMYSIANMGKIVGGRGTETMGLDDIWHHGACDPQEPDPASPTNLDGTVIYPFPWNYAICTNLSVVEEEFVLPCN